MMSAEQVAKLVAGVYRQTTLANAIAIANLGVREPSIKRLMREQNQSFVQPKTPP